MGAARLSAFEPATAAGSGKKLQLTNTNQEEECQQLIIF
jgi:hypothetical protein